MRASRKNFPDVWYIEMSKKKFGFFLLSAKRRVDESAQPVKYASFAGPDFKNFCPKDKNYAGERKNNDNEIENMHKIRNTNQYEYTNCGKKNLVLFVLLYIFVFRILLFFKNAKSGEAGNFDFLAKLLNAGLN